MRDPRFLVVIPCASEPEAAIQVLEVRLCGDLNFAGVDLWSSREKLAGVAARRY